MPDLLPPPSDEEREWVLHVDLDQFLAAVEVLRRPEARWSAGRRWWRWRPDAVASGRGDGVVRGEGCGRPLRHAPANRVAQVPRCGLPSARPARLRGRVRGGDGRGSIPRGAVEEWGWDEACVGVRTADPVGFARRVQATVYERTSLRCAVGIGETRLQAKTATGFAKPGGVASLTRRSWLPVMGAEPVTAISGIGARIAARLGSRHRHRR